MLEYLFLVLGISIIVMVISDFAVTVFVPKGAGFITGGITIFVAKLFKLLSGNTGNKKILEYKLVFIIAIMIISWLLLIWIAVALIYSFDYNSVVNAETKLPAQFDEKLYFTGYTISTLGLGDYQPNGTVWRLFTSVVSLLGFMVLTISITYIVPVINSIIEKQTLTLQIASLGQTTQEILANGYNGNNFEDLSDEFTDLSNSIFKHAKNHSAYPVLHHVHPKTEIEQIYSVLHLRRRMLKALVEDDGFHWEDTTGETETYFPEYIEKEES